MKKSGFVMLCMVLITGIMLFGCGNSETSDNKMTSSTVPDGNAAETESQYSSSESDGSDNIAGADSTQTADNLVVCFGNGGEPFILHLYDNDTAAAIARHVGSSDWNLPIYHYDDYDNWEVMQYYDIPSRYEIPSAPEQVTEEKAGAVYYSEPNRIIMFYQDAEVSAEYTPVGYFDYTDEYLQAVLDNPVIEGWGNKIVQISDGE